MNHKDTEARRSNANAATLRQRGRSRFFSSYLLCVSASLWLVLFAACSIPNLEQPECTEARDAVKRFYSFHFGNDMHPSSEYLKIREPFITADLHFSISKQLDNGADFFTLEKDYPKAFRVGSCEAVSPDKAFFQVLLFWKDDTRSEQKEIKVGVVKQNDAWLVNSVYVN